MRQRKKSSNKNQSHLDHKLRKRVKEGNRFQDAGKANVKKAKADSKGSGFLGTDGISYDGPNRRRYNFSQMQYRHGHNIKEKANAEKNKRDARRNRLSLNIRDRQRRKKGY